MKATAAVRVVFSIREWPVPGCKCAVCEWIRSAHVEPTDG